jgi:hypothetical protein
MFSFLRCEQASSPRARPRLVRCARFPSCCARCRPRSSCSWPVPRPRDCTERGGASRRRPRARRSLRCARPARPARRSRRLLCGRSAPSEGPPAWCGDRRDRNVDRGRRRVCHEAARPKVAAGPASLQFEDARRLVSEHTYRKRDRLRARDRARATYVERACLGRRFGGGPARQWRRRARPRARRRAHR